MGKIERDDIEICVITEDLVPYFEFMVPDSDLFIRKRMIKMGATTFWEEFDLDWMKGTSRIDVPEKDNIPCIHVPFGKSCYVGLRLSLCHGWASGPTSFLSRYVLGVKPIEPGYKKIKIEPSCPTDTMNS